MDYIEREEKYTQKCKDNIPVVREKFSIKSHIENLKELYSELTKKTE